MKKAPTQKKKRKSRDKLLAYHSGTLAPLINKAPYVIRITELKNYPSPLFVLKERREFINKKSGKNQNKPRSRQTSQKKLVDLAKFYGESLRRCLPVLKKILSCVRDSKDIPLELQRYLTREGLRKTLTLPLDEEAGVKIGLISKLQVRVKEFDRVELIAHRVSRFSREEASYWLSRTTSFGPEYNKWAVSGLRIMLGGLTGDPGIEKMLEQLKNSE